MKISFDTYTKDVDAACEVFKQLFEARVRDVRMNSYDEVYVNIMADVDHKEQADILEAIENGPFASDYDDL